MTALSQNKQVLPIDTDTTTILPYTTTQAHLYTGIAKTRASNCTWVVYRYSNQPNFDSLRIEVVLVPADSETIAHCYSLSLR